MTSIQTISVNALKKAIENDPNLILIDVREPDEWQEIHISKATLIPKDQLVNKIHELSPNKETPIYLHCRSGMRSLMAAQALIDCGYQHVYSVDGGIIAWANQGYQVSQGF